MENQLDEGAVGGAWEKKFLTKHGWQGWESNEHGGSNLNQMDKSYLANPYRSRNVYFGDILQNTASYNTPEGHLNIKPNRESSASEIQKPDDLILNLQNP